MQHIDPSRENWVAFKELPRDQPIHMLNMIRFRAQAAYPDDHACAAQGWSGAQAFAEYLRLVVPFIERLGGGLVWNGAYEGMVTGPQEPEWDRIFVMGFPDAGAFMALITDHAYKAEVVVHRTAAVQDSRLIRYAP